MAKKLTLADLIAGISGWHPDLPEMPVYPIIDSRDAGPGAAFFAFLGERVDGHDFVTDAFEHGAVAAVVERDVAVEATVLDLTTAPTLDLAQIGVAERPVLLKVPNVLEALQRSAAWWRQQLDLRVIGITGSVGKTTTKEMVGRVLETRYRVVRSQGSYNNEIGLPLTLLRLDGDCQRVVLEMGMYTRGDIRFLAGIAHPDVGIVTNVEVVHAERAGTIEEIALGKRELVEALPAGPGGVAILNYDDARVRAMAAHTQADVFYYGEAPQAHLWADGVESLGLDGIRLQVHHGERVVPLEVPLLGRHSVFPVLRAAAAGLVEGLTWDEIVAGLVASGTQVRLVVKQGPEGSLILDDTYNSSPPSALAALDLLDDLDGRKVAVLGDMLELGRYEEAGHLEVGRRAAHVAAVLVAVGRLGTLIAEGARREGMAPEQIYAAPDSVAAAEVARPLIRPGDVVLIKGSRGVKMEQIVAALTEAAA